MSCGRAHQLDLENLLSDPESSEARSFIAHCGECDDCHAELAAQRSFFARLRGEDVRSLRWHPADEELLTLRSRPDDLPEELHERIRSHFSECAACRDAYQAYRMLAASAEAVAARETLRDRLRARVVRLSGVLSPMPRGLAAAAALVLVLGVGTLLSIDPFDRPTLDRGGDHEAREVVAAPPGGATEVTLAAGVGTKLRAASLEGERTILRLILPEAAAGEWRVDLRQTGGSVTRREIHERVVASPQGHLLVEVEAGWLVPGSYEIGATPAGGGAPQARYTLRVE